MNTRVFFGDKRLEKAFDELPDNDPIKKGIIKAMNDIKGNWDVGRLITKDTHNKLNIKKFLEKYNVDTIRIYNLPSAWRLFYGIKVGNQIEILAIVLDWMDHKEYERMLR